MAVLASGSACTLWEQYLLVLLLISAPLGCADIWDQQKLNEPDVGRTSTDQNTRTDGISGHDRDGFMTSDSDAWQHDATGRHTGPNIIDQSLWRPIRENHPWDSEPKPENFPCDESFRNEEFDGLHVFEIDTGMCSSQTFVQETLTDIPAGASVVTRGFHFDLTAPEPSSGHFSLSLAGETLFDERPDIPGPSGGFERKWRANQKHAAGTPVYLHVHNHGQNQWILIAVEFDTAPD